MGTGLTEAQKQAMLSAAILKLDEGYVIVDNVLADKKTFSYDAQRLSQFFDGEGLDHLSERLTHKRLTELNAKLLALAKEFKSVSYDFRPKE